MLFEKPERKSWLGSFMKILFIGDIFGRAGRKAVKYFVPKLREEENLDLVIANGENARHGNGFSLEIYDELKGAGVDWFTGGDHSFSNQNLFSIYSEIDVLRPLNYTDAPGRGMVSLRLKNEDVTIINLQGNVFMRQAVANPFLEIDKILPSAKGFIFVDFHAEATSEKNTFGHYIDGRVGAVVGTHTHVQTADERILPKGTAYISDTGMTGPMNGSIGASIKTTLPSFLEDKPFKLEPADGPIQFNGVVIETSGAQARSIKRIFEILPEDLNG